MADLSPAAQAVLDAINKELDEAPWDVSFLAGVSAAAALRAVADQAAPELPHSELDDPEILKGIWGERRACRAEILAIATELEGQQ
jgi:hypothetical protein